MRISALLGGEVLARWVLVVFAVVFCGSCSSGPSTPSSQTESTPSSASSGLPAAAGSSGDGSKNPNESGKGGSEAPTTHPNEAIAELINRLAGDEDSTLAEPAGVEDLARRFFEALRKDDRAAGQEAMLTVEEIDRFYKTAFASMLKNDAAVGFKRSWEHFSLAATNRKANLLEVKLGKVLRPSPTDGLHTMLEQPVDLLDSVTVRFELDGQKGSVVLRNLVLTDRGWRAQRFDVDVP